MNMKTLFIVGSCTERRTVADLGAKMASMNQVVVFLFIREGCQCLGDEDFIDSIDFAAGRYALKEYVYDNRITSIKGVEVTDYDGWVNLLEECENVVSWT